MSKKWDSKIFVFVVAKQCQTEYSHICICQKNINLNIFIFEPENPILENADIWLTKGGGGLMGGGDVWTPQIVGGHKGHPPSADLRYGEEDIISPSTHIFAALDSKLRI